MKAIFWGLTGIVIALLLVVFLAPIVQTPLTGDEAFNSYFSGLIGYERITPWEWFLEYTRGVAYTQGRFFPGLMLLQVIKFTLTHDDATLKWANIVAIGVNLVTFGVLATRLGGRRIAVIATVIAVATLQARLFYNPITEITIELQVICELILLGCLAAIDYAERLGPGRLTLLAIPYLLASLTYEISYPFIAVFVGLVFLRGSRAATKNALITLGAVFASFVAFDLVLRHIVGVAGTSEYAMKPTPAAYLATLFDQTCSAIPLTYFFADPSHIFGPDRLRSLGIDRRSIAAAVLATLAILGTAIRLRPSSPDTKHRLSSAWFIATCLFVVPSILIALSGRWQHEVKFGLAYQPVYVSGFGAALLIALILDRFIALAPRYRVLTTAAIAVVIGATMSIAYQANQRVYAREAQSSWAVAGNALFAAERDGAFDTIPDGSTILLDSDYPILASDVNAGMWAARYQLYMYTHRRYHVWVRPDPPANPAILCATHLMDGSCGRAIPNLFAVWIQPEGGDDARAITMPVRQFDLSSAPGAPLTLRGSSAVLFEKSAEPLNGTVTPPPAAGYTWTPIGGTHDYRLWRGESACANVPAPLVDADHTATINFGPGFYGQEGLPGNTWHWSGPTSSLRIVNTSVRRRTIDASAQFQTSVAGTFPLTVREGRRVTRLTLSATPVRFDIRRELDPGAAVTLTLQTDAPPVASNGDPRDLRFEAVNAEIVTQCAP